MLFEDDHMMIRVEIGLKWSIEIKSVHLDIMRQVAAQIESNLSNIGEGTSCAPIGTIREQ